MYIDYFVEEKGDKCKNYVLGGVVDFFGFFDICVMLFRMFIQFFYKFFVIGLVKLIDSLFNNNQCDDINNVDVLVLCKKFV